MTTSLEFAGEPVEIDGYMTDRQMKEFLEPFRNRRCCAMCRFWKRYEPPHWNEVSIGVHKPVPEYDGECRRHSPVVWVNMSELHESQSPLWPHTVYDDWCGDFELYCDNKENAK